MVNVYLGLGSNYKRADNMRRALEALRKLDPELKVSKIYESASHGASSKPPETSQSSSTQPYYNCAAKLNCNYSPEKIKAVLTDIEKALGRDRNNPSIVTIDIDLLLYGDLVVHTSTLSLPHPDLLQFRHVLLPITELASGMSHPVTKIPLQELLKELPDQRSLFQVSV